MSENFDLLGDPIPEGWGKRGRPEHIPTQRNRNKVMLLLALGWSNDRIARALSITRPTLKRHYFRELRFRDEARDRMDAALAHKLWTLAQDGNVGAAREFRRFVERNDLMLAGMIGGVPAKPEKEPKLGKKEAALAAAREPDRGSTLGELIAKRQGQLMN